MNIIKFGNRNSDKKHMFMSNYWGCEIEHDGIVYKNTESFFQAMKFKKEKRKRFADLTPRQAKSKGNRDKLTEKELKSWESRKDLVMTVVCFKKFDQNPDLLKRLLETDNAMLIEDTSGWNDKYWGQSYGVGKNKLGKILVELRDLFKLKEINKVIYDSKVNALLENLQNIDID